MMNAKEIYFKTIQFCWLKLLLGIVQIVIAGILLAIFAGFAWLFSGKDSDGTAWVIMFFIWLGSLSIVSFFIKHYLGYLLKAGHVGVIALAFRDGVIPAEPFKEGVKLVKGRFVTSNVYFVIDKLVAGAVKQLQRVFGSILDLFGKLPGVNNVKQLVNLFLNIALGYIDECCLGWTFYNDKQNAYKSAADGVVIYAQNWKTLLKSAAVTTAIVIVACVLVWGVSFAIFGGLCKVLIPNAVFGKFVGAFLALMLAYTIKYAFIDTWVMVNMMSSFLAVAPSTQITFDLYGKLKGLSGKFGELLKKGESEPNPVVPTPAPSEVPPPPPPAEPPLVP